MKRRLFSILFPAAFIVAQFIAPALAQNAGIDPAFDDVVKHPIHQHAVIETAKSSTGWVKRPCPSASFEILPKLGISKKPEFDAAHNIIAGAWKESVLAKGCGEERQLNVLVQVKSPNQLDNSILPPGTSLADPLLQMDSRQYLAIAAGNPPASCTESYISDTKFTAFKSPNAQSPANRPPWSEEWTLVRCNEQAVVTLHFSPDSTGTAIHAAPGETRHSPLPSAK